MKVSELTGKPLTKGFDKQIQSLCTELEELKERENGTPKVTSCERMGELTNGN